MWLPKPLFSSIIFESTSFGFILGESSLFLYHIFRDGVGNTRKEATLWSPADINIYL